MGNFRKTTLHAVVAVSAMLALTSCTGGDPERDASSPVTSAPTTAAAEPAARLSNRLASLTDLQGRPLYVVPDGETRNRLNALASPPLFERTYTPAECAPGTAFTVPPTGLEGVFGRSHISDDQSGLRVWIYSAPDEAELVEYFVGADPGAPARSTDFRVTTNGITEDFSHTHIDTPPVALHSERVQYSVTQDKSTTHHVAVTAINGIVAARVTLSTTEPADQTMIDAVLDLAQQAAS